MGVSRAAASWMHYTLDTKTFVGEEQSEEDFTQCDALLAWGRERFPDSPFFGALSILAPARSIAMMQRIAMMLRTL